MNKTIFLGLLNFLFLVLFIVFVVGVEVHDYAPSFYIHKQTSSTLLVQHFESEDSVKNQNASLTNTSIVSGKINNSINITQGCINYFNRFDLSMNDFRIELWIKTNTTDYTDEGLQIIGKYKNDSSPGFALMLNRGYNTGKLSFIGFNESAKIWELNSTINVTDNVWHYVLISINSSSSSNGVVMFVDSSFYKTSFSSLNFSNNENFTIGSTNCEKNFFNGSIDELAIYNISSNTNRAHYDSLLSPSNNSELTSSAITLNWTNATDVDNDEINYTLYVSNESDFSNLVININTTDTNYSTSLNSGTYFWRVKPWNILIGGFSIVKQFIINNVLPTITWTVPNNDSYIPIFRQSGFTQNITFNDDHLNQYNCTIYNDSAMTNPVWSVQKTILGNTTYVENSSINTSGWHGVYYENCTVSDT